MMNWFKTLFPPVPEPTPGDPFSHPEIARMSRRELADLPLKRPPAPPATPARAVARGSLLRVVT